MPRREVVVTELGREIKRNRCGEFWPADLEFWYSEGKRGFSVWCKACYREWRNERNRKRRTERHAENAA